MNDEYRLSDEPVELPPQGIGPEIEVSTDAEQRQKICSLLRSLTDRDLNIVFSKHNIRVTFKAQKWHEGFDKHMTDSLMWDIHWFLGELETQMMSRGSTDYSVHEKAEAIIRLEIPIESVLPYLEKTPAMEEQEGVEREN